MTGLRPRRNVVGEDIRDMDSTIKEYRTCSTSWDYTHTVYATFPPGSEPGEQWKEDGFRSRFQQHDGVRMVEKPPTWCRLQTRGVRRRKEKERERDLKNLSQINCCEEKGHPTPPYIGQGGVPPSLPFPCGTKPKGGGDGAPLKGVGPFLAPWPKGETPSSLNGPFKAYMPFSSIFKYI